MVFWIFNFFPKNWCNVFFLFHILYKWISLVFQWEKIWISYKIWICFFFSIKNKVFGKSFQWFSKFCWFFFNQKYYIHICTKLFIYVLLLASKPVHYYFLLFFCCCLSLYIYTYMHLHFIPLSAKWFQFIQKHCSWSFSVMFLLLLLLCLLVLLLLALSFGFEFCMLT